MGEFVSKHLNIDIKEAKEIQRKYYKQHGTTLRGMMDNHGVDPDYFLSEVHKLDYSIIGPNIDLNEELKILEGRKIIYTNANLQHTVDVLERLQLTNMFTDIFDIKKANYIPKPEISPYNQFIKDFNIDLENSIMIGDKESDIECANNFGIKSIQMLGQYDRSDKADYSCKNWLEVERLLRSMKLI